MISDVLISRELQTEAADVLIPNELLAAVGSDSACETPDGASRDRRVICGEDSSGVGGALRDSSLQIVARNDSSGLASGFVFGWAPDDRAAFSCGKSGVDVVEREDSGEILRCSLRMTPVPPW